MTPLRLTATLGLLLALAACGGGGGGSASTDAAAGATTGSTTGSTTDSSGGSGSGSGSSTDTSGSTGTTGTTGSSTGTSSGVDATLADPANQSANLSGTAATGAALANAQIVLHCSGQPAQVATADAQGRWTATVKPVNLPCALRASGTGSQAGITYHSVVLQAGVANLTPLTDAMVALMVQGRPAAWFDALASTQGPGITAAQIGTALTTLKGLLPTGVSLPAGANPITTAFSANGTDALDRVLDQIASALRANAMTWTDALDYVLAETAIDSADPIVTALSTLSGQAGDRITVTGLNLPVSPVPPIALVSESGASVPATVLAGNTSTSLTFTVPTLPGAGAYTLQAGTYRYPASFFYVDAAYLAARYAPYYTDGTAHNRIAAGASAADGILGGGWQYLYSNNSTRASTGNACFAKINGDGSISRLNASGTELMRYSFERSGDSVAGPRYRLYAQTSNGLPDQSRYVDYAPGGAVAVIGAYFLFNGTELCASPGVETTAFQFFAGPALNNWKKAEGSFTGAYVTLYRTATFTSGSYSWDSLELSAVRGGTTVSELNLTINESSSCEITVSGGGAVTFAIDGQTVASAVSTSDTFQYAPPLLLKDFDTLPSQIEPYFPASRNFRLISHPHPYILSTPTPMVIELGLPMQMGNHAQRVVTLYYGVSDYGATPGSFRYRGAISCSGVHRKGSGGAAGTYIDEVLGVPSNASVGSGGSATNVN